MRTIELILILILLSLNFGCEKEDKAYSNKDVKFFPKSAFEIKKLNSNLLSGISDSLMSPSEMAIVGDNLILLDRKSKRPIHVINILENTYLGSFVKKGQGPSEVHIPWKISPIDNNSLGIYDVAGKKLLGYVIDSLIANKSPFMEKKFNEKGICSSVQIIDDNIYYTSDLTSSNRIFKLDTLNNIVKGYGTLLNNHKNISEFNFGQGCRGTMSYSNNNFVISYLLAPYFEIFNKDNNSWISILSIDKFAPIFSEVESDGNMRFTTTNKTRLGFIDISLSNDNIYLLYSGEMMQNHKNDEGKTILVYDFKGNPKMIYELDNYISSFEVYNDEIIYGLKNDVTAQLLRFKI